MHAQCSRTTRALLGILWVCLIVGCSTYNPLTLMPTPLLYQNTGFDPFEHLRAELKNVDAQVFYATNRGTDGTHANPAFNDDLDDRLHLGKATVHMGEPETDWDALKKLSLAGVSTTVVPLSLQRVEPLAEVPIAGTDKPDLTDARLPPDAQKFFDGINAELALAVDKEIMVYVHGAKVGFDNSAVLTAEIDHFAGRDFVGVAFSWPAHKNIVSYLLGIDVNHALNSSIALRRLLELLAEHTQAQHINIISYSAGGRVVSKALLEMRTQNAELDSAALQRKFRLGSVVFAAADVPVDRFLDRLPAVSDLATEVVITVSDKDDALMAAKRYMGGTVRTGSEQAEATEADFIEKQHLRNVEIIDVSMGHDNRGFDIVGHHYWYRHPWISSDMVFLLRTDLPAAQRGLTASEIEGVWYLSPDYPHNIKDAASAALHDLW